MPELSLLEALRRVALLVWPGPALADDEQGHVARFQREGQALATPTNEAAGTGSSEWLPAVGSC